MLADFCVRINYEDSFTTLACEGELDVATSRRLREALDICLGSVPETLLLDLSKVTLLTSSGIETILEGVKGCRERGIHLQLEASSSVRRVLDLVGLWWVGVIEDGISIDQALTEAHVHYANLSAQGLLDKRPRGGLKEGLADGSTGIPTEGLG